MLVITEYRLEMAYIYQQILAEFRFFLGDETEKWNFSTLSVFMHFAM
jgi:hypothetical protein